MEDERDTAPVRLPDPTNAEQDASNANAQAQVRRDHDELQRAASRIDSSVPREVRERTVGEIVAEVKRRAQEGRHDERSHR